MPISAKAAIGAIFLRLSSPARGQSSAGNDKCPCLSADHFIDMKVWTTTTTTTNAGIAEFDFEATLGASIDPRRYGIGCLPHDERTLPCSDAGDCTLTVPLPPDCDKSYCRRSWCYVDPEDCDRRRHPSARFDGRHYSYATCGELDSFAHTERLRSLGGRVFNVGYGSNTGGWKGAYNPSGSFAVDDRWTGPAVDFVERAALGGGFKINVTRPPEWLRNHSREFFGNGDFDLCVYATSLGYLDFCVGGFTITERRGSVTTMFEIASDPIYLIGFADASGTDWESFSSSAVTVFKPLTTAAWIMILVLCLPLLGVLMLLHEYGAPGSAFPRDEPVLVVTMDGRGDASSSAEVVNRPISMRAHVVNSIYMGTLSFLQGSYDLSVVSAGGKIHLLAIASFIMLILAVYTANLAAILTQYANKASVDSVGMAVKLGMNICAERKVANFLMESYGVERKNIVPDPITLGGDGQPGFYCPKCRAKERVFDQMRRTHDNPSWYCNVAVASREDIEILHRYRNHCNKTKVGNDLAHRTIGIPIHDGDDADALVSLLHKAKADGVMTRTVAAARPRSQCPERGGEGTALDVRQLTGVWVVTFAFASLALFARLATSRREGGGGARRESKLRRNGQWGDAPPRSAIVGGYRYDAESDELVRVDATEGRQSKEDDDGEPDSLGTSANEIRSAVTPRENSERAGDQKCDLDLAATEESSGSCRHRRAVSTGVSTRNFRRRQHPAKREPPIDITTHPVQQTSSILQPCMGGVSSPCSGAGADRDFSPSTSVHRNFLTDQVQSHPNQGEYGLSAGFARPAATQPASMHVDTDANRIKKRARPNSPHVANFYEPSSGEGEEGQGDEDAGSGEEAGQKNTKPGLSGSFRDAIYGITNFHQEETPRDDNAQFVQTFSHPSCGENFHHYGQRDDANCRGSACAASVGMAVHDTSSERTAFEFGTRADHPMGLRETSGAEARAPPPVGHVDYSSDEQPFDALPLAIAESGEEST